MFRKANSGTSRFDHGSMADVHERQRGKRINAQHKQGQKIQYKFGLTQFIRKSLAEVAVLVLFCLCSAAGLFMIQSEAPRQLDRAAGARCALTGVALIVTAQVGFAAASIWILFG